MGTEDISNLDPAAQAAIQKVDERSAQVDAEVAPQGPPKTAEVPQDAPKTGEVQQAGEAQKGKERGTPAETPFTPFFKEFEEKGALSDESIQALEKMGLPKAAVDAYIAGLQAQAQAPLVEAYQLAGSEDAYKKMASWAADNLSQSDKDAFNEAVTGTPGQRKQAILALKAQYEASFGSEPLLVGGQKGSGNATTPFASRAEVTQAMRDPRYSRDPAYRAQVMSRIAGMDQF